MRRNEEARRNRGKGSRVGAFWGRALCVLGMLFVIVGSFFVSVALGALGVFLGLAGDILGARELGRVTVLLGAISIFVGLFIGQGSMASSYDSMVDRVKKTVQYPLSDNSFRQ